MREKAKKTILEKRDLFDKDKLSNNKQLKELEDKLFEYMNIKSNLKSLLSFEEKKKEKKLILI